MADPTKYAFAKPERAFHPAVKLLCTRAGQPDPDVDGAARVVFAAQMYGELRDLWKRERGFDGDLLDVHTFLFTLAPQGGVESGWARAMTPEIVAELVREYEAAEPNLDAGLESAAETVRGYVNPSSSDPLAPLTLHRYAMGMGSGSFCWAVEHGTGRRAVSQGYHSSSRGVLFLRSRADAPGSRQARGQARPTRRCGPRVAGRLREDA